MDIDNRNKERINKAGASQSNNIETAVIQQKIPIALDNNNNCLIVSLIQNHRILALIKRPQTCLQR